MAKKNGIVKRDDFKPNLSPTLSNDDFGNKEVSSQKVNHKSFDRFPIAKEVGEKEIVFAEVTGTVYIVTKINGAILKVALT